MSETAVPPGGRSLRLHGSSGATAARRLGGSVGDVTRWEGGRGDFLHGPRQDSKGSGDCGTASVKSNLDQKAMATGKFLMDEGSGRWQLNIRLLRYRQSLDNLLPVVRCRTGAIYIRYSMR